MRQFLYLTACSETEPESKVWMTFVNKIRYRIILTTVPCNRSILNISDQRDLANMNKSIQSQLTNSGTSV